MCTKLEEADKIHSIAEKRKKEARTMIQQYFGGGRSGIECGAIGQMFRKQA
jgi:hypothetical protein